jgi:hypothetical protein
MALVAGFVLCGMAAAAQQAGSLPESMTQPGVPRQDLGPRSLPPQGFPPEPNGLPPRPGSPESRLPPTPPTQMTQQPANPAPMTPGLNTAAPGNNAMPAPIASTPLSSAPASTQPRRAEVQFANGMLEVRADDSSLQQILRSIARRTGMKITGGVADERVYGNYGPAPASSVLATLLDGTGVNMFLQTTPDAVPEALVLTPKTGAASPPSLDMSVNDEQGDAVPHEDSRERPGDQSPAPMPRPGVTTPGVTTSGPVSIPQPANNVNGSSSNTSPTASTFPTTNSVPLDTLPSPSTTPPSSGIVDAPNPPPPGSTTSQPSSGASTPEQIYQQLLKLQQQQQQKQQGGSNGTAPPQ